MQAGGGAVIHLFSILVYLPPLSVLRRLTTPPWSCHPDALVLFGSIKGRMKGVRQYQGQDERLGYFFQLVGAELGVKLAGCVLGLPNHPRALALALDCPATDGQALSCSGAQHQPSHRGHESARTDHVRQSLRFLVSISNSPRVPHSHLIPHAPNPTLFHAVFSYHFLTLFTTYL